MDDNEKSLSRQVAEKLGFYIYHYNKDRAENCYYLLSAQSEGDYDTHFVHRKTEAEAWLDVPQFDSDIRLAMALLDGRTWDMGHSMFRRTYSCSIVPAFATSEYPNNFTAEADTLEVAICKAFLQLDLDKEAKVKELGKARQQLAYQEELVKRLEDELKDD